MLSFVHPALLWGLPLIGVPVLIHLINMLRHRRVEWAAMEFLLQSQKKNRTWIILRQLLLLLMRMAAIAVVVLVVAGPLFRNRIGAFFGRTQTHHIVLLDDSFSMSDRRSGTTAFADARQVVRRIAAEAARQIQPQAFTLLRFSRAAGLDRGTRPDLLKEPVGSDFTTALAGVLDEIQASQAASGPGPALQRVGQLLDEGNGERRIVHVVSDFRAKEWDNPTDLREQLTQLQQAGAEIQLVNCVEAIRPNLAVSSLAALPGIRAAGVPWFMEVAVENFGATAVRDVSVQLAEDGQGRPSVTIAEIPPGRTVRERFPVHFSTAGEHEVVARLESDAVAADNFRYATLELPADVPVLIVDSDPGGHDARYLAVASSPGGTTRTGIRPRIETPRYLGLHPLDEFHTIGLVNVERLDRSAVEALEAYVSSGGGVVFFLGERCRSRFINEELHRRGEGLFPLPVGAVTQLPVDRLERAPDLAVEDHFIFRVFAGKRNSFLNAVVVQRYFAVEDGWKPEPDSTVRVLARLRNGAPLAVEQRFGEGRVVAFLTSAAPTWNNWARNPAFVVAVQDLQAYLARRASEELSRQVGTKLELSLDAVEYRPKVRFVTPDDDVTPGATIDAVPGDGGTLAVSFSGTDAGGIYQALLTKADGSDERRRFAFNVDTAEGDLKAMSRGDLAERLAGLRYEYRQAADFQYTVGEADGYNISDWLLYLLIVLLIGEQLVAWWASYHPAARSEIKITGRTSPLVARRQEVPTGGGVP